MLILLDGLGWSLGEKGLSAAGGYVPFKMRGALGFDGKNVNRLLQCGVQVLYYVGTLVFSQAPEKGIIVSTRSVGCDWVHCLLGWAAKLAGFLLGLSSILFH